MIKKFIELSEGISLNYNNSQLKQKLLDSCKVLNNVTFELLKSTKEALNNPNDEPVYFNILSYFLLKKL